MTPASMGSARSQAEADLVRVDEDRTVLVVDDDPGILDVLEQALEAEGYRVLMASNGAEALDRAARGAPDVTLVDLMMPVMDGPTFVRRLRQMPGGAAIPVIILSA